MACREAGCALGLQSAWSDWSVSRSSVGVRLLTLLSQPRHPFPTLDVPMGKGLCAGPAACSPT